ncbi:hypothetical protein [Metabacillus sp. RGM 3146]|uniref:hypothetical protein n=1 Tax=Metabacillus sp. RGM 3146 TaxID=3401092 RepID=UPI003B9B9F2E
MLKDHDFHLISKALVSSYESLSREEEACRGIHSLGDAHDNFLKALAHASSVDHKMLIQTLYDR